MQERVFEIYRTCTILNLLIFPLYLVGSLPLCAQAEGTAEDPSSQQTRMGSENSALSASVQENSFQENFRKELRKNALANRKSLPLDPAIKRIFSAYRKKDWPKLQDLSAPQNSSFRDYALYLSSEAILKVGAQELYIPISNKKGSSKKSKPQHTALIKRLETALSHLTEIETQWIYSPLRSQLDRMRGLTLMQKADAFALSGDKSSALKNYLNGLQLLHLSQSLALLEPASLSHFFEVCPNSEQAPQKKDLSLCEEWMNRVLVFFPKNSAEANAAQDAWPEWVRPKAPSFSRSTQPYKGTAPDQLALDQLIQQSLKFEWSNVRDLGKKFLEEFPRSSLRWRALYWIGRAEQEKGNVKEAQAYFTQLQKDAPYTYYSLLSRLQTQQELPNALTVPSRFKFQSRDPFLSAQEKRSLLRAEILLEEGFSEWARLELSELKRKDTFSNEFSLYLAELQSRAGNHSIAFGVLTELFSRNLADSFNREVSDWIFPTSGPIVNTLWVDIQRVASDAGVDPLLVLSLIKQESAFDSQAGSGVGAMGLMQLMSYTAIEVLPGLKRRELFDPEVNLKVGTRYLKQLIDQFGGNIAFALAAYNAGPTACNRWRTLLDPKHGLQEWVETIGYKETREYVAGIIRNYYGFHQKIYPDEKTPDLSYFWKLPAPTSSPAAPSAQKSRPRSKQARLLTVQKPLNL